MNGTISNNADELGLLPVSYTHLIQDTCSTGIRALFLNDFKTYSKSFKNNARIPNPEENWAVFKNVHEPIIARGDFEKVQTLIAKTKRRAPKPKNGEKSIFCDLLFCGDCHGKLRHHTNTINKDIHYFVCANNKEDY